MKSHVSDYLKLAQCIYEDACARCAVEASYRDLITLRSRVKTQGLSFLTITLPNFCRDFERSLEAGFVDSTRFRSFRKRGSIPAFLQGMTSLVFDQETGRINDNVQTTSPPEYFARLVDSVRQFCLAFKKIKLPCSEKRNFKALQEYVDNESAFEMFSLSGEDLSEFRSVSSVLWDNIVHRLRVCDAIPRHGPRATAEGYSSNEKYSWQSWHERLEPYFPLVDSAFPISIGEMCFNSRELDKVHVSEEELPVKVVLVPKTLKAPRIIAVEPCCMQYAQQGLKDVLYRTLETSALTAGHINFSDQTVNQRLAMSSSSDGQFATIDLSEASDRVPRDLALEMFQSNPAFRDAIDACRSTKAKMPDGTIVSPLRKFASMGSALCFPVEAMYFYTICVLALLKEYNLPVSHREVFNVSREIYVYGDDIIVPAHAAATVCIYLQKYNCKINENKTFRNGSFRESCGLDAFLGFRVTPVYVRASPPANRQQASELISWNDTANLFFKKGYLRTSCFMFDFIERYLGPLPSVPSDFGGLGRNFPWHVSYPFRVNKRLQRREILAWVPSPVYRTDPLDGYAALQKSLERLSRLKDLNDPRQYDHLERTARFHAVALKRERVPEPLFRWDSN